MMSISPQAGQPTWGKLAPSSQKAGQIPMPEGSRMRASQRPSPCSNLARVLIRAEV